jgi:osmoprotectant transport system permease protein
MTPVLASAFDTFEDAIDFLLHERSSVLSDRVKVGGSEVLDLAANHMRMSVVAILLACAVALPIGLWLGHIRKGEFVAVTVSNVGRAVPTLALLAFFVAYIGTGFTNIVVVLTLLAIPPILTNAYVGVTQADPETVDAARGVGMTEAGIVRRVELPLATPLIFGGIRTSSVNVVATATIAPLAAEDSLGTPIINNNVYGDAGQLGAAIAVALLTVLVDFTLGQVQRLATPKGIRSTTQRTSALGRVMAVRRTREGRVTT